MSIHKKRRKEEICHNCRTILQPENNFCPSCGQENHDLKVPLSHLAFEVFEGFTHFDTKFYNTIRAIFLYPGKITKDFLEGRRGRYVPPVRLYFLISFVFFLTLDLLVDKVIVNINDFMTGLAEGFSDKESNSKLNKANYNLAKNVETASKELDVAIAEGDTAAVKILKASVKEKAKALKILKKADGLKVKATWRFNQKIASADFIMDEMNIDEEDSLRTLIEALPKDEQRKRLIAIQKQIILDMLNTEVIEETSPKIRNYFSENIGNKRLLSYSLNPFALKNKAKINIKYDADTLLTISGSDGTVENSKYKNILLKMSDNELDSLIKVKKNTNFFGVKLLNRGFTRNYVAYEIAVSEDPEKAFSELAHLIIGVFSLMMFILMPIVAVLLKIIYSQRSHSLFSFPFRLLKFILDKILVVIGIRKTSRYRHFPHFMAGHTRYYYEHLIFSIHIHAVFFLMILIFVSIGVLIGKGGIAFVCTMLGFFVYFIFSLKRVYRQGLVKTLFKSAILFVLYFISFILILSLTASIKFALA